MEGDEPPPPEAARVDQTDERHAGRNLERPDTVDDLLAEKQQEALSAIALRAAEIQRLKSELDQCVSEARDSGATWRAIGRAAGIGGTVALRRWDPVAHAKQLEREREARRRQRGSRGGEH